MNFIVASGLLLPLTEAYSKDLIYFDYTFTKKSRLSKVYKQFILQGKKIRRGDPGLQKTIISNPHIKDWKILDINENIKLYISKDKANLESINQYLGSFTPPRTLFDSSKVTKSIPKKKSRKKPNKATKPIAAPPKEKIGKSHKKSKKVRKDFFYLGPLVSKSIYTEELNGKLNVEYDQNSIIGLNFGYKRMIKDHWFFLNDLKVNYLQKASLEGGSSGESSIPPELVNTTALLYKLKNYRIYPFVGIEYNKFSTFNLERNFLNSSTVELISHHIFLLKIGFNYNFNTFRRNSTLSAGFAMKAIHLSDYNADSAIKSQISYGIRLNRKYRYFVNYSLLSIDGTTKINRNRVSTGLVYFIY